MIDLSNGSYFKFVSCDASIVAPRVVDLMLDDEIILLAAKSGRDFVVFTDKRILAVNVPGMTGMKRDYTSLPYSRIQAFSVETLGPIDLDAELELWFIGLGKVKLKFRGKFDITYLGKLIASKVL